jgi:hypothetical protein
LLSINSEPEELHSQRRETNEKATYRTPSTESNASRTLAEKTMAAPVFIATATPSASAISSRVAPSFTAFAE